jgi:hypothetical protein
MPEGANVLHVASQSGVPTLWCDVDPQAAEVAREFEITGTGHPTSEKDRTYLGTAHCGSYVWHVWEVADEVPVEIDGQDRS